MERYPWKANLSLTFSQIHIDEQEAKTHQNIINFQVQVFFHKWKNWFATNLWKSSDQIGSIYGRNVLQSLIQICVDKSQRRFQFSAAHFQEFIDGEWEGLFLWDLSKENLLQFDFTRITNWFSLAPSLVLFCVN